MIEESYVYKERAETYANWLNRSMDQVRALKAKLRHLEDLPYWLADLEREP